MLLNEKAKDKRIFMHKYICIYGKKGKLGSMYISDVYALTRKKCKNSKLKKCSYYW